MLAVHALGLVALTATVLLGIWQYGAWQAGRELAARDLADARPLPLDSVLGPDAPFPNDQVGRPVTFSGVWVPEATLEVADRPLEGRDGRWVVTPVAVCSAGAAGGPDLHRRTGDAGGPRMAAEWCRAACCPPAVRCRSPGGSSPARGPGSPDRDPDDAVLPELRIASAIQFVDQDLYGGFVIGRDLGRPGRCADPGDAGVAARARVVHVVAQPALCAGVVGVRRVRALHLGPLGPRRGRTADPAGGPRG